MNNGMKRFKGPDGLKQYLSPQGFNGSMVELPLAFNPFYEDGVRISAMILYNNPTLSGKFFPAANMLQKAKESGKLTGKKVVKEASSGNMAGSFGMLSWSYGIERVVAIVPPNIAAGKKKLLEVLGLEVIVDSNGIEKAKELNSQDEINLWQYGNSDNPAGYEEFLAPELWELSEGKISLFVAGLGTTGTMQGVANYLKKLKAPTKTLGVITSPGEIVPGVRTDERLKEVSFDWKDSVDFTTYVGKDDSMVLSLALSRMGLLAGPSSGFALAGLLQFIAENKTKLDDLRNADGEVDTMFICFDTLLPYLDDYLPYVPGLKDRLVKYFGSLKRT